MDRVLVEVHRDMYLSRMFNKRLYHRNLQFDLRRVNRQGPRGLVARYQGISAALIYLSYGLLERRALGPHWRVVAVKDPTPKALPRRPSNYSRDPDKVNHNMRQGTRLIF